MASTQFRLPDGAPEIVDMAAFAADLTTRRAALGGREAPRNPGDRRTASKRALLAAIGEAGGRW